jgi:Myc proto-oncogene protein
MFEGVSDPLLANQVTAIFFESEQLHPSDGWSTPGSSVDMGSVFDWTPPASPISSLDCDDLGMSFEHMDSDLNADDMEFPGALGAKSGSKRKASALVSEFERKKLKAKAEQDRVVRTEACEKAVAELASKNDEDPESRRHTHNVLERKRRNDLKNSYQLLRECLPSLEENERAPTGQILLHAVEYISSLDQGGVDVAAKLAQAKLENQQLRASRGMTVA